MVDVMFAAEDVQNTVRQIAELILQQDEYDPQKVAQWQERIVEESLKKLQQSRKPFKYMVNCIIMQKSGAGLHVGCSANCDQADGVSITKVEVRSMFCVVVVIGSSLSGL